MGGGPTWTNLPHKNLRGGDKVLRDAQVLSCKKDHHSFMVSRLDTTSPCSTTTMSFQALCRGLFWGRWRWLGCHSQPRWLSAASPCRLQVGFFSYRRSASPLPLTLSFRRRTFHSPADTGCGELAVLLRVCAASCRCVWPARVALAVRAHRAAVSPAVLHVAHPAQHVCLGAGYVPDESEFMRRCYDWTLRSTIPAVLLAFAAWLRHDRFWLLLYLATATVIFRAGAAHFGSVVLYFCEYCNSKLFLDRTRGAGWPHCSDGVV